MQYNHATLRLPSFHAYRIHASWIAAFHGAPPHSTSCFESTKAYCIHRASNAHPIVQLDDLLVQIGFTTISAILGVHQTKIKQSLCRLGLVLLWSFNESIWFHHWKTLDQKIRRLGLSFFEKLSKILQKSYLIMGIKSIYIISPKEIELD